MKPLISQPVAIGCAIATIVLAVVTNALAANCGVINPLSGQRCVAKGTETTGSCTISGTPPVCSGTKAETQYSGCNDCVSGTEANSCYAYIEVNCVDFNNCTSRFRTGACGGGGCVATYGNWSEWGLQQNGKACELTP